MKHTVDSKSNEKSNSCMLQDDDEIDFKFDEHEGEMFCLEDDPRGNQSELSSGLGRSLSSQSEASMSATVMIFSSVIRVIRD